MEVLPLVVGAVATRPTPQVQPTKEDGGDSTNISTQPSGAFRKLRFVDQ